MFKFITNSENNESLFDKVFGGYEIEYAFFYLND
jgi:hypothetical protein